MSNAPTAAPIDLEAEGNWYDDAFAPGKIPSFADFVRAHIDSTFVIVDDVIRKAGPGEFTQMYLPGNYGLLFCVNTEKVGRKGKVTCVLAYLYDNHDCKGRAIAGGFTFIMQVAGGKEKDIFRTIDRTKWSEISTGMFGLLQNYPATTCRLLRAGDVGYSFSSVDSMQPPATRARLLQAILNYVLPTQGLEPLVMLYDVIPQGYHCPRELMYDDYLRMNATDRGTARAMMMSRATDDAAYCAWLRTEMKAFPIPGTDLSMMILDHGRYDQIPGLFQTNSSTLTMAPTRAEPRKERLSIDEYMSGKYTPVEIENDELGLASQPMVVK